MAIRVGDAVSFRRPESWEVTPDDRQEVIETLGGVYVQDNGLITDGEKIACQVVFDEANFALIKQYWQTRALVQVTDHAGNYMGQRRVVVKKYCYVDKHPRFYVVDVEFWRK